MSTIQERIAVLELKVQQLGEDFSKHAQETRTEAITLEQKLDDLLTLKNKGMGAFWLASTIFGTGIVGGIVMLINYLRG